MKSTLKITALVLALAGFTLSTKAQTNPTSTKTTTSGTRYSIGVDAGVPTGTTKNTYDWNIGGSLQADIPVVSQLFVTVNAGYNNFVTKSAKIGTPVLNNIQLLPVKAGLKIFPVNNFYVQGEAGAEFLLNKKDVAGADKTTVFVYAPQIGYQFAVGGNSFIDAGVRYEATSKLVSTNNDSKVNFIGLRVAYGF
jgi:hypothetical protein